MPGLEQFPSAHEENSENNDQPTGENYDHLFDPNRDDWAETGVEAARVQNPLTQANLARLALSRGKPVTAEEVKYMNMARERGIHHSIV